MRGNANFDQMKRSGAVIFAPRVLSARSNRLSMRTAQPPDVYSPRTVSRLPGIFATGVIEKLAGLLGAERRDETPHLALSDGSRVAFGPPISVCTQPGLMTTQVMPRRARSIARLRMTMFTAALELR